MSVPVIIQHPVVFEGRAARGRKQSAFVRHVEFPWKLEELHDHEAPVVLDFRGERSESVFRKAEDGTYYKMIDPRPSHGQIYTARYHVFGSWLGRVALSDVEKYVSRELRSELTSAWNASSRQSQLFKPEDFSHFDGSAVEEQIRQHARHLERFVVVGDDLYMQVDEPTLDLGAFSNSEVVTTSPWQKRYFAGYYSLAEIGDAVEMAALSGEHVDRSEIEAALQSFDAHAFTKSLVARRIVLFADRLLSRIPNHLLRMEQVEVATFIADMTPEDRSILRDAGAAAASAATGTIGDQALSAAERVLYLDDRSVFRILLSEDDDVLIERLRQEWEDRPVSLSFSAGIS